MHEIKCPNCGKVFVVDEFGYAQIRKQIRDKEFEKEIKQREIALMEMKESDLKLARMEQKKEFDKELLSKESEILEREKIIEQLKSQISEYEIEKKLAISEAINEKE